MRCPGWKKIQSELDAGAGFSAAVRDHLDFCTSCSRDLKMYRRLIRSYAQESEFPTEGMQPSYSVPTRHSPALFAAAALFGLLFTAGVLLGVPRFQAASLHREYFQEFSESVIDGGIFEYADLHGSVYTSSWF